MSRISALVRRHRLTTFFVLAYAFYGGCGSSTQPVCLLTRLLASDDFSLRSLCSP